MLTYTEFNRMVLPHGTTGVIANGEVAVENGAVVCHLPEPKYPAAIRNTIKLSQAVTAQDLQITAGSGAKTCKVYVIGGSAISLLTEKQEAVLAVKNGKIQPDPERWRRRWDTIIIVLPWLAATRTIWPLP